jgi:hypothetical protein
VFLDEKQNISSSSGLKPLLIVLESEPKWLWFQTTADEGSISSGSRLGINRPNTADVS